MYNEIEKRAVSDKKKSLQEKARAMNWLMPCGKFCGNTVEQQIGKVKEELAEVETAYQSYNGNPDKRMDLLMECADVQISVETLMQILGANDKERNAVRCLTWHKNNRRGYFKRLKRE